MLKILMILTKATKSALSEPNMEISHEDVLGLLHKWKSENHIIHCTVMVNGVYAKIPGRLDSFENGIVHISLKKSTLAILGEGTFLEFPIEGSEFHYDDAAHMPEPLRSKMAGYDSVLYIFRAGDVSVGLAIMPPIEEWAKL